MIKKFFYWGTVGCYVFSSAYAGGAYQIQVVNDSPYTMQTQAVTYSCWYAMDLNNKTIPAGDSVTLNTEDSASFFLFCGGEGYKYQEFNIQKDDIINKLRIVFNRHAPTYTAPFTTSYTEKYIKNLDTGSKSDVYLDHGQGVVKFKIHINNDGIVDQISKVISI